MTTAPAYVPTDQPASVREMLEMVGPELLLHASDYPHNHGAGAQALYDLLTDTVRDDVRDGNAAAFYRLAPASG